MRLQPIRPEEILLQHNSLDFPLVFEYLGDYGGGKYYEPNYDWYQIIVNVSGTFESSPVVGVVCLDAHAHILPNSAHISVLEIRKDLQRSGFGTRAMQHLISLLQEAKYQVVTLQIRNLALEAFYMKLGFRKSFTTDKLPYYRLYLQH